MTKVTIYKTNSIWKGFTCTGHTGYKNAGKDVVCASISVLVINTINYIETFLMDANIEEDDKNGFISFQLFEIPNEVTTSLLDAMVFGLQQIEKEYGKKYLELKFEEV